MKLSYKLVGYDRRSQRMVAEYDIPADKVSDVRKVARIDARHVGDCALDVEQAKVISDLIEKRVDLDHLDFMLEPSRAVAHV